MKTRLFSRKPFFVRALQVTLANMDEIAAWTVGSVEAKTVRGQFIPYVKVPVILPRRPRQEEAYDGDWVVAAGTGFKVYTPQNFARDFDPVDESDLIGQGLTDTQIAIEMDRTREACGGVRPAPEVGPAAQSHFQFQTGIELDWNHKEVHNG